MSRDNVLFVVIGLLAGFIAGYVMHESMSAHQPQLRAPQAAAAAQPANPGPGQGANSGQSAGGGPAMAQVQRLTARIQENPEDTEALRLLANLNYDINNWGRAAELYARYLELVPSDFAVMTDLGAVYRYLGRPQDALEQFSKVRELSPEHWQSRYNEVLVLAFDLGDLSAASQAIAELVSLQPENQEVARLAAEVKKRAEGA